MLTFIQVVNILFRTKQQFNKQTINWSRRKRTAVKNYRSVLTKKKKKFAYFNFAKSREVRSSIQIDHVRFGNKMIVSSVFFFCTLDSVCVHCTLFSSCASLSRGVTQRQMAKNANRMCFFFSRARLSVNYVRFA